MTERRNEFDQPIGFALPDWKPVSLPPYTPMQGVYCRVEPINYAQHADDLFNAFAQDPEGRNWTYLPSDPVLDRPAFDTWMHGLCRSPDPMFHAVIDGATDKAVGSASLMRMDPAIGSIEVGYISFSPLMQRSRVSTEAIFLMMRRVFDELGYRRFEWKCDSLNGPSRSAAERFGFTFEGIFRQATIYKGRNRDTAWYSIIDSEWPAIRSGFQAWLDSANFDASGQQHARLADLIAGARPA